MLKSLNKLGILGSCLCRAGEEGWGVLCLQEGFVLGGRENTV